ncbi:Polyferredoxin NapH (periplasmic nitrate reductase) [Helicobacter heilmannii]|uniref:quinol dehydrogenase ferredoxin subunit NapH n=1 Tax=Helicobacter heilmannii TaxID=35817 RepID=UPI0006A1BEB1|nr:quinol dehydrogenase ferredoxin subunit NapH [Helicobacter heilmannii]CRF49031.1 Polyferredoxin NapH (periplasmic nitrate reductase) [Helicobacter heilmannii]
MRYLILRRLVQCGILVLFAANTWILKGNLSASRLFNTIPLSDPFAALQVFLASLHVEITALLGALLVLCVYGLFLGRAFCAWVCPVNMIVDFAAWVRRKLQFRGVHLGLPKNLRYVLLILSLILSFVLATPAFESVSFIGVVQRGIILGTASWLIVALLLFCVDAFLGDKIICSKLCPLGAFYALTSRYALLKVKHDAMRCTKCELCWDICPERQVLWMVGLKSVSVNSGECTRCGRCIEVCEDDALGFSILDLKGSFKKKDLD